MIKISAIVTPEAGENDTPVYVKVKKLVNRLNQEKASRLSLEDYVRSLETSNPENVEAFVSDISNYIKACEDQLTCIFDGDDDQSYYVGYLLSNLKLAIKSIAKKNLSYKK